MFQKVKNPYENDYHVVKEQKLIDVINKLSEKQENGVQSIKDKTHDDILINMLNNATNKLKEDISNKKVTLEHLKSYKQLLKANKYPETNNIFHSLNIKKDEDSKEVLNNFDTHLKLFNKLNYKLKKKLKS